MAYKTGWLKKVINGVPTKVFAFAHAKTVYSDFANKLTLEDFLQTKKLRIFVDKSDSDYYREIEPVSGNPAIKTPPIIVNGSANSYSTGKWLTAVFGNLTNRLTKEVPGWICFFLCNTMIRR